MTSLRIKVIPKLHDRIANQIDWNNWAFIRLYEHFKSHPVLNYYIDDATGLNVLLGRATKNFMERGVGVG